ncbi:MAG: XisI protein [Nostoc sp. DedQUE04]|nr:XisI protein [Nostoc sp. DedQUE04]
MRIFNQKWCSIETAIAISWMDLGWNGDRRIHGCLVHIDLIDGKIWIQRDGTEEGIAADLERAGIPKEHIVLGFRPPELRPYTGYAVA